MNVAWIVRKGVQFAAASTVGDTDPQRLHRQFRVAADWDRSVDGRAPRLRSDQTIAVTRLGRFADRDPLTTVEGWRDLYKVAVVASWLAAVGVTAAAGYWGRRGPLAGLRREEVSPPGPLTDVGAVDGADGASRRSRPTPNGGYRAD